MKLTFKEAFGFFIACWIMIIFAPLFILVWVYEFERRRHTV